ncbi:MAG: Na/Pi cotransporter family protein [Gammaproteobacteria bacterium HGW-Gammaproteobacteria-8]|nr:MAG: Na/Pi cotransporter family protein [Gammaproteobacteria bacterium HGW-Gammaproteobacteria-8]
MSASAISLQSIFNFLGGIGLFLLGMRLMTDGLKVAAGPALRGLLTAATGSTPRALGAGALITALVQSSSAVIFAVIGFVNAGLLSLAQAVGLIFGANLGTTLTSWIVAMVGFEFDLGLISMPAIAAGMALWLSGKGRRPALGQALVGFGVFFLGLAALKSAFSGLGPEISLSGFPVDGISGVLLFTLLGAALTMLMQSSSASLALTLTAASQGLLPLPVAAAMVIGANIGTSSTAVFATIGATAAARRTAAAHVLFNLLAGALGLVLLKPLLITAEWLAIAIGAGALPATELALLHTLLNLIGVLVAWPLLPRLVRLLEARFQRRERDDPAQPRYLDATVAATPGLALDATRLELVRLSGLAHRMAGRAISVEDHIALELDAEYEIIDRLGARIIEFASGINSGGVAELDALLPSALRIAQHHRMMAERANELARMVVSHQRPEAVQTAIGELQLEAVRLLDQAEPTHPGDAERPIDARLAEFEARYQACKSTLLRAGSRRELSAMALVRELDRISALRRIVEQAVKARLRFDELMHPGAAESSRSDPAPIESDPASA